MMRLSHVAVPVVLLLLATSSSHGQNAAACQSVEFSPDVLSRLPDAPKSCLDVVTRNGQQYAVIKAKLEEVRGDSVRVRVKNPDGSHGPLTTIKVSPNRKVLINGKPYPLNEVATDQELTAYVRVDTPMIALAPAADTEPVEAVPMPAADTRVAAAPTMPHTASPLGTMLLFGVFCLAIAFGLRTLRTRDK
jgi:hypothetical protein